MARYFVAGNFWIAFALVTALGQSTPNPYCNTFFGAGSLSSPAYSLITYLSAAAGIAFFVRASATSPDRRPHPKPGSRSKDDLEFLGTGR
jgi:hypothetical protein